MRKLIASVIAATLLLFGTTDSSFAQQATRLPQTSLSIGVYLVSAEVAATELQRRQGLMHREQMGANEGMLFVYDAPIRLCMWMKNTQIPLSVAFIDARGVIVNIEDMQPNTLHSHCAKKSVPYALEMNRGWFRQRNIAPGNLVQGLPTAP